MSQPVLFAPVHQNYTSPSAYGSLPGQVAQTPLPVMDIPGQVAQTPLPVMGAFPLAPVHTPQPGEDADVLSDHLGIEDIVTQETLAVAPAPSQLPSGDSWPVFSEAAVAVAPASGSTLSDDEKIMPESMQAPETAQPASSVPADELAREQTTAAQSSAEEAAVTQMPVEVATLSQIPVEDATISQIPVEAATVTSSVSEASSWISPCGHANPPGVRFCRICGQPAAPAIPLAPEPGSNND